MPKKATPLEESEIPQDYRHLFDFKGQKHTEVILQGPRSGKRELCIPRICSKCSKEKMLPVAEIRRKISRGSLPPLTCRDCTYDRRVINGQGYVLLYEPSHPRAYQGKYVPEHILVMERTLGRLLDTSEESVHHINGDKADNRIQNLQLRKRYHGKGVVQQCQDCGSHNIEAMAL